MRFKLFFWKDYTFHKISWGLGREPDFVMPRMALVRSTLSLLRMLYYFDILQNRLKLKYINILVKCVMHGTLIITFSTTATPTA